MGLAKSFYLPADEVVCRDSFRVDYPRSALLRQNALARFIHEFHGPIAAKPDFMRSRRQFDVPWQNDRVSNPFLSPPVADPHINWLRQYASMFMNYPG